MKIAVSSALLASLVFVAAPPALADPPPFSIGTTQDSGHSQGRHQIALIGNFPFRGNPCADTDWPYTNAGCYRADVYCDGAVMFAEIVTPPPVPPQQALTTMLLRFPEMPSGSRCSVVLRLSESDNAWSSGEVPLGVLAAPPIEIAGVVDRGIAAGQRHLELYGQFPTGQSYQALATCNGTALTASVTTPNSPSTVNGQVNISFPDAGTTSLSCEIRVRRNSNTSFTPARAVRLNGSRATAGPLPAMFGAYHWGGFHAGSDQLADSPAAGVLRLREAGLIGPLRMALSPDQQSATPKNDFYNDFRYATESNFYDSRCSAVTDMFLGRAVCTRRMQTALNLVPAGGTVIFTAMDQTSLYSPGFGHGYVDLAWMSVPANAAAVTAEYYRLAKALYLTQSGGKTFIISNWEGDNQIFCGSAYGYASHYGEDPTKDAACPFANRREALRLWFEARKEGIRLATVEIGGAAQVTVADAIEISAYRLVQERPGLANQDALHGIVPLVKPRYVLYSAWDTVYRGLVDQDLREIAEFLSAIPSSYPIKFMLGEFGRAGNPDLSTAQGQLIRWLDKEQISAAKRVSLQTLARGLSSALVAAVIWMGYDTVGDGQGLLTTAGVETEYWRAVAAGAAAPVPLVPTNILGVRDQGATRTATHRTFELYGSFGGGPYAVQWKCNKLGGFITDAWTLSTGIGSSGQVNVTLPLGDAAAEWWCVFRLSGGSGPQSADFGPIRSCGGAPCNADPLP